MTETEQFLATMGPRITDAEIRARMGRDRADLRRARAAILGLPVVPEPDRGRRSLRDLAYTVSLEHTTASVNGAEPRPYVLRVTTIFRREDGEWKVVHRHANAAVDPGEVVDRLARRP